MSRLGAGLTSKNSHELVTVSMTINTQPARSIYGDLLCVFYQYLVKGHSFSQNLLCLSDSDKFTKEGSNLKATYPEYIVCDCSILFLFYDLRFTICLYHIVFMLSSLKLKFGGMLDFKWENLRFSALLPCFYSYIEWDKGGRVI